MRCRVSSDGPGSHFEECPARRIDIEAIVALDPTALLIDFDGTLVVGDKLVPGAAELVEAYAGRCAVITNNSSDTPAHLAERLAQCGIVFPKDRIFSAGVALVEEVARSAGSAPVLAMLSPAMRGLARSLGVTLSDSGAALVAVGRDQAFDYRTLASAANAVKRGARLIAANGDGSHPGPHGTVIPETGSIIAAINAVLGSSCEPEIVGKPAPRLASAALACLGGAERRRVVVVGDNRQTDGVLAASIGAIYHHVGAVADAGSRQ